MAFRYGLGRQTAAHYDALRLVREHWPQLAPWRETIVSDLRTVTRVHQEQTATGDLADSAQQLLDWICEQPDPRDG